MQLSGGAIEQILLKLKVKYMVSPVLVTYLKLYAKYLFGDYMYHKNRLIGRLLFFLFLHHTVISRSI